MKNLRTFFILYGSKRNEFFKGLETALITLGTLALMYRLNSADPWGINSNFSWICIIPVFCSLFYSMLYGFLSFVLLFGALALHEHGFLMDDLHIREYIFVVGSLTFISGYFNSFWASKLRYANHVNYYTSDLLSDLTKNYYLLKISHERIEHQYMIKPMSFREAIAILRQEAREHGFVVDGETGLKLLTICSQYCTLSHAALFLIDEDNNMTSVASLGKPFDIDIKDSLIAEVLMQHSCKYFAVNRLNYHNKSDYLVAIPLMASKQRMYGLLVIKDMPFYSLTEENLEALSVFVSSFMVKWDRLKQLNRVLQKFPNASPDFIYEFAELKKLKTMHGIDSALCALILPEIPLKEAITHTLNIQKRALDFFMTIHYGAFDIILILLPLTDLNGALGYKKRMGHWFYKEFGLHFDEKELSFHYKLLTTEGIGRQIRNLLDEMTHARE